MNPRRKSRLETEDYYNIEETRLLSSSFLLLSNLGYLTETENEIETVQNR